MLINTMKETPSSSSLSFSSSMSSSTYPGLGVGVGVGHANAGMNHAHDENENGDRKQTQYGQPTAMKGDSAEVRNQQQQQPKLKNPPPPFRRHLSTLFDTTNDALPLLPFLPDAIHMVDSRHVQDDDDTSSSSPNAPCADAPSYGSHRHHHETSSLSPSLFCQGCERDSNSDSDSVRDDEVPMTRNEMIHDFIKNKDSDTMLPQRQSPPPQTSMLSILNVRESSSNNASGPVGARKRRIRMLPGTEPGQQQQQQLLRRQQSHSLRSQDGGDDCPPLQPPVRQRRTGTRSGDTYTRTLLPVSAESKAMSRTPIIAVAANTTIHTTIPKNNRNLNRNLNRNTKSKALFRNQHVPPRLNARNTAAALSSHRRVTTAANKQSVPVHTSSFTSSISSNGMDMDATHDTCTNTELEHHHVVRRRLCDAMGGWGLYTGEVVSVRVSPASLTLSSIADAATTTATAKTQLPNTTGVVLLPHGQGRLDYDNDDDDDGDACRGDKNSKTCLLYGRYYQGTWSRGHWNGQGESQCRTGTVFTGTYSLNQRHGQGRVEFRDGRVLRSALFVANVPLSGRMEYPNGSIYQGEWDNHGRRHGVGRYTFAASSAAIGSSSTRGRGRRSTNGITVNPKDNGYDNNDKQQLLHCYEGEFWRNGIHGYGTMVWAGTGCVYQGYWAAGKPAGFGWYMSANGTVRYQGLWHQGRPESLNGGAK